MNAIHTAHQSFQAQILQHQQWLHALLVPSVELGRGQPKHHLRAAKFGLAQQVRGCVGRASLHKLYFSMFASDLLSNAYVTYARLRYLI